MDGIIAYKITTGGAPAKTWSKFVFQVLIEKNIQVSGGDQLKAHFHNQVHCLKMSSEIT